MPKIDLSDAEVFTLRSAVEQLRGGMPDDDAGRERRSDAAFRIASNLEKIARRAAQAPSDDAETLRKALYELLHVSFPPVGEDTEYLAKKHYEAVGVACGLLGLPTTPTLSRPQQS